MKPSEAKASYGATHYLPLNNDPLTPTLYYAKALEKELLYSGLDKATLGNVLNDYI